jgi:hypothetical protein
MTSGFEAGLGVICASVPSLKFYFRKFFDRSQSAISGSLPSSFNSSIQSRSTGEKASRGRKGSSGNIIGRLNDHPQSPNGNFSELQVSTTKLGKKQADESYGYRDVELGTISVTREVDVESVYNEPYETEPKIFWARETSTPRALSLTERPLREYLAHNARVPESWLDEDSRPATPTNVD